MQLTGPPRIGGLDVPYPTERRPLEQVFDRDTDVENYVKGRDGGLQRVGPRHYRAQFRFRWDMLGYELAHDILSVVSQHPVDVVPRTKRSGDPSYLTEQTYSCRVVGPVPRATPINRRRPDGTRLARVELELEALSTVTEIPDASTP